MALGLRPLAPVAVAVVAAVASAAAVAAAAIVVAAALGLDSSKEVQR